VRRALGSVVLMVSVLLASVGAVAAQDVDMAFSEEKLRELGYPTVQIQVGPDGIEAPSTLEAGYYLIELSATTEYWAWMNITIPPDGLDRETAIEQALMAGSGDTVLPGWTFLGGTNTFSVGVPTLFAMELQPGEYSIAASYYVPDFMSETGEAEEIMDLAPLTVTASATPVAAGTPQASPVGAGAPQADVVMEMTDDLEFIVTPDPLPAGPQLWELTNTGTHHHHHMVMYGVPEGTTADDIIDGYLPLFEGEEPAEDSIINAMVPMGYAALQSGGATTWNEFDLEPGTYVLLCFISDTGDPEDWRPHLLDGMVTIFEVE
jgi:hypothetical protein